MALRRGKDVPRLPLSAFTAGASDSFPIPPTPSLVSPRAIVDAHLDPRNPDVLHLKRADDRAAVLRPRRPADEIVASMWSLESGVVDAPVLSVLVPFSLDAPRVPGHLTETVNPSLTAVYDGATPVGPETEGEAGDRPLESSVNNLRWALQHGRVVDLDIDRGIIAIDASAYDGLVNLLTKAITSDAGSTPPVVLTNVLPPPLDAVLPVVTMANHPTYNTFRQRTSSLSLFANVSVKLLPPAWVPTVAPEGLDERQEKELRNLLKLFIVPVLEAFGFDRIIFGSSPAFADGSPHLAEFWYKLVLESFRELAVSQEEMDKIFSENARRVYGSSQ